MTDLPGHRLGRGPLTLSQVVRDALGMLRQSFRRVALVSLLLFGLPALLAALVDRIVGRMLRVTSASCRSHSLWSRSW